MISFGRNLSEYAKVEPFGVYCVNVNEQDYFLTAEHFNFESIKKILFYNFKFIFLTESGELYNEKGKMEIFNGKIVDMTTSKISSHFFIITDDGKVYSWGWGSFGQLGLGHDFNAKEPTLIQEKKIGGEKVIQIRGGHASSIALTESGSVYLWGSNKSGKLGLSRSEEQINSPMPMPKSSFNNKRIIQIGVGNEHYTALTEDGDVHIWGSIKLREGTNLINVPEAIVFSPVQIKPSCFNKEKVVKITVGSFHNLALTEKGNLYAWGANTHGQLGSGNLVGNPTPNRVELNQKVDDIIEDIYNYSVVVVNGQLYGWGAGGKKIPERLRS